MKYKKWISLLTILLILIFGVWYWGIRLRLEVVETHIEPPALSLQAQGYDTTVRVVVRPRGLQAGWLPDATLDTLQGSQPQMVSASGSIPMKRRGFSFWDERKQVWELKYPLKLRDVTAGKVMVRDQVALHLARIKQADGTYDYPKQELLVSPVLNIEAVARTQGATVFVPKKDTNLKVLRLSCGSAPAGAMDRDKPIDAVVRLEVKATKGRGAIWNIAKFDLVDAEGKRLNFFVPRPLGAPEPRVPFCLAHLDTIGEMGPYDVISINVGWPGVKPGALRIRGRIVLDQNWPLELDIPIRDDKGKIITRPLASPEQASGVRIAPVGVSS